MSASDLHPCVAFHLSGLRVPESCLIGEETGAAAEDVAVEGTSAGGNLGTALGIIAACAGILVVGGVGCLILPAMTFGQRVGIHGLCAGLQLIADARQVAVTKNQMTGLPLSVGIAAVDALVNQEGTAVLDENVSAANLCLSANLHAGVVEHVAVLAAAEDGALDPRRAVDNDLGTIDEGCIVICGGVRTHAAAEDVAAVIGFVIGRDDTAAVGVVHLHVIGTYLAVADDNTGNTRTVHAGGGLAGCLGEVAHITHSATAIDVAEDEGGLAFQGLRLAGIGVKP